MEISPHKFYWVILRVGDWEKKGRCIHLSIRELSEKERKELSEPFTHVVRFFDFESHRQLLGTIKEEDEEHIIFKVAENKEYEFRRF